ncbi:MAG: 30S ribosomal protein S4 [Nitrospinae bacterium]|nr:30S ribosomal protein S4 [Nitrospinota bacterium]
MARYTGSVCRLCRREGAKLFLKGERCLSKKCAIERRAYAPGQHGQARVKVKEYGTQLREKQKVKRIYGVLEKQFRLMFAKADRKKGVTGENLLTALETRLDSVVLSGGLATSRAQARQLIRHNHIAVNGRRVNIPSFLVKKGDEIQVREKSRKADVIVAALDRAGEGQTPDWLSVDKGQFKVVVQDLPSRDQVRMPIQEQLIVELYSK